MSDTFATQPQNAIRLLTEAGISALTDRK